MIRKYFPNKFSLYLFRSHHIFKPIPIYAIICILYIYLTFKEVVVYCAVRWVGCLDDDEKKRVFNFSTISPYFNAHIFLIVIYSKAS